MERKLRHAVVDINYHLILVTKYRRPVINEKIAESLKRECTRLLEENFEGHVTSIETDKDHIHILTELSPKYALMDIMSALKGVTSRIIRHDHWDDIKDELWGSSFWSNSYYAATTGGATLDVIKRYVESQGKPKRKYVRKRPLSSSPDSEN